MTYVVVNLATSSDSLYEFMVEARSRPSRVLRPAAPGHWSTFMRFGQRTVAGWTFLEPLVKPGQSTAALVYQAVGLPDIAHYSALRYTEPVEGELGESGDTVPPPPVTRGSGIFPAGPDRVGGVTVGIVPIPAGATVASLTNRLRTLLGRTCGDLGWINQNGVCHSLDVKLLHATEALAAAATGKARIEIEAFVHELDAQHGEQPGKHVSVAAYALLRPNAVYLLARR
jgi:hypothetical protein